MSEGMQLNIADYLDEDERRAICRDAFRDVAMGQAHKDFERIMFNAAYQVAFEIADKQVADLGDDARSIIEGKVRESLSKLDRFYVFRQADAWERSESPAFSMMCEAVRNNKPLIDKRVTDAIGEIDAGMLRDRVEEIVGEIITERLTGAARNEGDKS